MHRLRKLIRGQNHAEHIARFLSEEIGTPYYRSALIKRNYTKRQALLSRSKRLLSQKNSFMVSEKFVPLLRDKNILLVDDIVTTGSTVGEAKKVLMEAGAKSVFVIALAH